MVRICSNPNCTYITDCKDPIKFCRWCNSIMISKCSCCGKPFDSSTTTACKHCGTIIKK
ncbi:hypothetical protein [Vallitalea maricola]|uniref:hypothetical protein n=1 Tax=Vallitalea maricola TaxID=3074433 RepID=UPI0030D9020A